MPSVHVVYEIHKSAMGYFVEFFDKSDIGVSPDQITTTMNLPQLMDWLKNAEAIAEEQSHEYYPPLAAGVNCNCPSSFCPLHGKR